GGAVRGVEVEGSAAPFVLSGGEVEVPNTGAVQPLRADGTRWQGLFTPPSQPGLVTLRVRLQENQGTTLVVDHRYRLQGPDAGVVQRISGTGSRRFFALAIAPDGTVWAGGDAGATIVRVPPGATTASNVGQLAPDPGGRVEASVVDQLGRLHFVVFAAGSAAFPPDNQDVVLDRGTFCATVNAFDPHQGYPFRVREAQTNTLQLSASTRATAAGGGDIWL